MVRSSGLFAVLCLSLIVLWTAGGCGKSTTKAPPAADNKTPADDHDHDHGDAEGEHDHGDAKDEHAHGDADAHEHGAAELHTLAEGIASLEKHYQQIKDAFAQNDAEKAHDPMHGVGLVLEALPELGKAAGLSADDATNLQQAVDKLMEAYGSVDEAMHEGKTPDYQAVAETIDQQMAVLRGLPVK
jgi:hypothetical protein